MAHDNHAVLKDICQNSLSTVVNVGYSAIFSSEFIMADCFVMEQESDTSHLEN